ncbi:CPBP family glutamic-type intramembrane protease [Fructilactobacillus vespulae]|uniref:CPBP family glutamic-type intramembrane protease n=1 Tax=Fructilactobacillus vespulae TaxID=1249630 RepID=UPI0039B3896C
MNLFGGLIALVSIYGYSSVKILLKPMIKGSIKRVFIGFILATLISLFGVSIYYFFNIKITGNSLTDYPLDKSSLLILILMIIIQITGEELIMAVFTLPILNYFSNKNINIKYSWLLANLTGCLIFMVIHLPAYQYNVFMVIIIGFSRYPFTMLWFKTKSLRGGIYSHLLFDLIRIVPKIFI